MNTIKELVKQDKRIDLRGLNEYRKPLNITYDVAVTAEGSVKVQIGETEVIVGVKLSVEKPYNDTPDRGGIMINAELIPLSSPDYEPGPPSIKAIELSRVIDRGIREAKAIDMKKLCITPGEKAWFVLIDIVTLNDAGNLFDAAALGVIAALKSAKFPVYNEETGTVDYKNKTDASLPLLKFPLSVTIHKVEGKLLIDPVIAEEKVSDARLTVASDNDGTISAMQKGGSGPLTLEEIDQMVSLAIDKSKELREVLNNG